MKLGCCCVLLHEIKTNRKVFVQIHPCNAHRGDCSLTFLLVLEYALRRVTTVLIQRVNRTARQASQIRISDTVTATVLEGWPTQRRADWSPFIFPQPKFMRSIRTREPIGASVAQLLKKTPCKCKAK